MAKNTRRSFGRIDKLPSGRWRARYVGPDGLLHSAPGTFERESHAVTWLGGQRNDIATGTWKAPAEVKQEKADAKTTLGEYAETWLRTNRNRKGEPLRPRTVSEYKRLLAGPLKSLTGKRLSAITPGQVDDWYAEQSESGKLTQVSRAYSLLSTIFTHAIDRGRVATNPCKVRGGQSARTGRKVVPPTDAELATIIESIPDRFKALVYLAAEGGLRYGEATDLRRSDLAVEHDEHGKVHRVLVSVTHAVTRTDDGYKSGPPKSEAGVRSVYIYGKAAQAIATHLDQHVIRFGDPLLFTANSDDTGQKHLPQSTFHTPHWRDARKAAGRDDMPFHALRHRAGTAYVQHGATMAEAMQRLGHSSTTVAMRYQHATGRDAEIAARMAGEA